MKEKREIEFIRHLKCASNARKTSEMGEFATRYMIGGINHMEKIQIFNPKAKRYILINKDAGKILRMKSDKKPYENIPILKY